MRHRLPHFVVLDTCLEKEQGQNTGGNKSIEIYNCESHDPA